MLHKTIDALMNETCARKPKKIYTTNKSNEYQIDDTRMLEVFDKKEGGPEKNRAYNYFLVMVDIFSKICWTVTLKK